MRQMTRRGRDERGHVVLAFLFCLLTLITLSPDQHLSQLAARHDRVMLQTAKTAVITWAAARYPGREEKSRDTRIGEMVMPDKDGPDAQVGAGTQDGTVSIGRLPWKTLGIPPLFDAHGELLWYTVSSRFRDNGNREGALHCHSLRQIAIYAKGHALPLITADIAAVVIAPHRALSHQQRQDMRQKKQVYQYIESAHKEAGYLRSSNYLYRHLMQGNVMENGRVVMNDVLLPIECRLLERALKRRRHSL